MHVCVYIYVYISFHSGTQSSMMIVIIVSMYIIVSDTPRRYIKDARNVVGHGLFFLLKKSMVIHQNLKAIFSLIPEVLK